MLAKNSSGLITSCCHWHGLVVPWICTQRSNPADELCQRWMSMACCESNSFLQWAHLKPNDMGNLFGPSGFPLPAPRRMLSVDRDFKFNLLQGSASGQIDSYCSETGTKHNSKRRITIRIVCIATDWSVQIQWYECARITDYDFTIWMKNNRIVRSMIMKLMRIMK